MSKQSIIKRELVRNYILANAISSTPPADHLDVAASEIAKEDEKESQPIPEKWLELTFRHARKIWRFPAYSELRKAWETSTELHEERRAIVRAQHKALPAAPEPEPATPEEYAAAMAELERKLKK